MALNRTACRLRAGGEHAAAFKAPRGTVCCEQRTAHCTRTLWCAQSTAGCAQCVVYTEHCVVRAMLITVHHLSSSTACTYRRHQTSGLTPCACGVPWPGMTWYDLVWPGMAWYGLVWPGMAWYDLVWPVGGTYGVSDAVQPGYRGASE